MSHFGTRPLDGELQLQATIRDRSFKEDRYEHWQQQQLRLGASSVLPHRHVSSLPRNIERKPCHKQCSNLIFTAIAIIGVAAMLIGVIIIIAQGQTLPNSLSFLQKFGTLGQGCAIGFLVGGGLLSLIGIIGIVRNCINSKREALNQLQ